MTANAAPLQIFLVAGEPSGDMLGAALMRALRERSETLIEFIGVGGPNMIAEGLESIFPIEEISVMGLVEVIPKISRILELVELTAQQAIVADPAVVVTIDCPDFSKRIAKTIRARDPAIPLVHYVAPSVWAWRPGRAKKLAKRIDHLLTLLPFEPPYFEKHGLPATFVGHPVAENDVIPLKQTSLFREGLGITKDQTMVVVLLGSRKGEVNRHAPVFREILKDLQSKITGEMRIVMPVAEAVAELVRTQVQDWPFKIDIIDPAHADSKEAAKIRKLQTFTAADVALCVSGTVSLELAACGTPMVVAYKTNPITAFIVKCLIQVKTATIVNLVAKENVVPEFFQGQIKPPEVAQALHKLISDTDTREHQRQVFSEVLKTLGRSCEDETPSLKAARVVLNMSRWKKDYYEDEDEDGDAPEDEALDGSEPTDSEPPSKESQRFSSAT